MAEGREVLSLLPGMTEARLRGLIALRDALNEVITPTPPAAPAGAPAVK